MKRPDGDGTHGTVYVDGSWIDGDASLAGLCARHGWAMAIFDSKGSLQASAKGRPPAWASGIYGAELWGLLMATQTADPWAPIRVDCSSVQQGAQLGESWASSPTRKLARAWAPIAAALEEDTERVSWMLAHCTNSHVGVKQLSNGTYLSEIDLHANALVDKLAKEAANADRLPARQREMVRDLTEVVTAVATWLGQITHIAGNFPDPAGSGSGRQRRLRDSEGLRSQTAARSRVTDIPVAHQASASSRLYDLAPHARWAAVHRRVLGKKLDPQDSAQQGSGDGSHYGTLVVQEEGQAAVPRRICQQATARRRLRSAPSGRSLMSQGMLMSTTPPRAGSRISSELDVPRSDGTVCSRAILGAACTAEPSLESNLVELEEMHKDGLKVVWPRTHRRQEQPVLDDEPAVAAEKVQTASISREEVQALAELEELQSCGLPVVWPLPVVSRASRR